MLYHIVQAILNSFLFWNRIVINVDCVLTNVLLEIIALDLAFYGGAIDVINFGLFVISSILHYDVKRYLLKEKG